MSTDIILEPDAEAFEESADTTDIAVEAVAGDYIDPDTTQDPEAKS